MLKWAREHAGLSAPDVASAEKIYLEQLLQWERGDSTPSLAMLRRLGKRYKRPLMVFYLPEPPQGFTVVKDFRQLPAGESIQSPELRYAIRRAQERQAWASEYLSEIGAKPNELVGSVAKNADVRKTADAFRQRLRITLADQETCNSALEAFRLWRSKVEAIGFFVFQAIRVDLAEMRGCALPDRFAPIALINSKDADVAKIFTLIHELGHLLLGESAITASKSDFTIESNNAAERFCNRFAGEVLVPRDDFLGMVPRDWQDRDDELLQSAARKYCVSRAVIAYRLMETGLADLDYLKRKWPRLQTPPKTSAGGGQPQHIVALGRVGAEFPKLALSAYHGGEIHGGALSSLLSLKLKYVPQLESVLYPGQIRTGMRA
jgi:Zn-dependent peptidase ImmA (M78 family)